MLNFEDIARSVGITFDADYVTMERCENGYFIAIFKQSKPIYDKVTGTWGSPDGCKYSMYINQADMNRMGVNINHYKDESGKLDFSKCIICIGRLTPEYIAKTLLPIYGYRYMTIECPITSYENYMDHMVFKFHNQYPHWEKDDHAWDSEIHLSIKGRKLMEQFMTFKNWKLDLSGYNGYNGHVDFSKLRFDYEDVK